MSPRHIPASVQELARVGIFGALPGEVLGAVAAVMHREPLGAGASLDPGDGFAVVLSGVVSVPGRVMRPGDHAGEDGPPGPLKAVMPSVVAWCEREPFERLIAPHLE